ncbi:histidinol-phosphate transaminase [Nitrincola iocasae]|uniref:Histidinol-phosphate aminotransferase n=1 Tax=Nitrincola iocasae TaxID=2614693 RepID=A0A5J6LBN4_9GAMM|nr:histidinol-phosphate transaminase [Nitrincola iocasae]QEW05688.1 histidinol-phosphate transaminase [Nitrincola iocasae]
MSCDFVALSNPGVQALQPYQAGKPAEELERELGIRDIVKLASNENPLGPSSAAISAVQSVLSGLTRYPDSNGYYLKQALSQRFNLAANQLTLGNGSNDLLELVARAFLREGVEAVYSEYAFIVYPLVVKACGATGVRVPARDYGHDLDAMADAVTANTRVIFIANPNNPTGTCLTSQAFKRFMARIPEQVLVVLDEAYSEYTDQADTPDGLALTATYNNLIVTRTFSKAYGLAALRVGFAVANPVVTDLLNRVRQPFNVSSVAQAAAMAALADREYLARTVSLNRQGLKQMQAGLVALEVSYIPSVANFITIDCEQDALLVYQALLEQGVIVRPLGVYAMPQHLRVTLGTETENQRFLDALKKVIA